MAARESSTLKAGWAAADITPARTSELYGQYYQRVARGVRDPLSVTALALEQGLENRALGQALIVSCDQAMIDRGLVQAVRERLRTAIPDLDPAALVISATHTHNAPSAFDPLKWWKHDPAFLSFEEHRATLIDAITAAAREAWTARAPSRVGTGVALASVGHCRRPLYRDGTAEMYGATDRPDFVGMEGGKDNTIGVIGCWSAAGELGGLLVNVPCPSQVMEAQYVVTADMYGEMRRVLREKLGSGLNVLCQVGAAGDQAPRDLTLPPRTGPTYWDEAGMVELGGRLARAVLEALPRVEASARVSVPLRHLVRRPRLPLRTVSPQEYARASAELAALVAREPADESSPQSAYSRFVAHTHEREKMPGPGPYDDKNDDFVLVRNLEAMVQRFQQQQRDPEYCAELHVLRLGDTAIGTSPFELYLDYGLRIRARSPAGLTLHAQLANDAAGYLPTARAVAAGGYGALVANGSIGPEGGDMVVEAILDGIRELFGDS